jgi:hypothetical protein
MGTMLRRLVTVWSGVALALGLAAVAEGKKNS